MSTYNPRNAFPREMTFVPSITHNAQRNAVNGPHLGNFARTPAGAIPTLAAAIASRAGRSEGMVRGSGGDAVIRSIEQRWSPINEAFGSQNQRRGLQRHTMKAQAESRGRQVYGQGRPATPDADSVDAAATDVLTTDISDRMRSSGFELPDEPIGTSRRERESMFPTRGPAHNETLLAPSSPLVTRLARRVASKVIPGQLSIPGI